MINDGYTVYTVYPSLDIFGGKLMSITRYRKQKLPTKDQILKAVKDRDGSNSTLNAGTIDNIDPSTTLVNDVDIPMLMGGAIKNVQILSKPLVVTNIRNGHKGTFVPTLKTNLPDVITYNKEEVQYRWLIQTSTWQVVVELPTYVTSKVGANIFFYDVYNLPQGIYHITPYIIVDNHKIKIETPLTIEIVDQNALEIATPTLSVDGDVNNTGTSFTLNTSGFSINTNNISVEANTHYATDWIVKDRNNEIVWASYYDEVNKTSITIPDGILELGKKYWCYAAHYGMESTSDMASLLIKTNSTPYNGVGTKVSSPLVKRKPKSLINMANDKVLLIGEITDPKKKALSTELAIYDINKDVWVSSSAKLIPAGYELLNATAITMRDSKVLIVYRYKGQLSNGLLADIMELAIYDPDKDIIVQRENVEVGPYEFDGPIWHLINIKDFPYQNKYQPNNTDLVCVTMFNRQSNGTFAARQTYTLRVDNEGTYSLEFENNGPFITTQGFTAILTDNYDQALFVGSKHWDMAGSESPVFPVVIDCDGNYQAVSGYVTTDPMVDPIAVRYADGSILVFGGVHVGPDGLENTTEFHIGEQFGATAIGWDTTTYFTTFNPGGYNKAVLLPNGKLLSVHMDINSNSGQNTVYISE